MNSLLVIKVILKKAVTKLMPFYLFDIYQKKFDKSIFFGDEGAIFGDEWLIVYQSITG
jgi:hypothetical protein